jgi:hypothetical protein
MIVALETTEPRKTSNAYNIFILALTILSLVGMAAMLLPLSETTLRLLWFYDTLICVIFLIDFFLLLSGSFFETLYRFPAYSAPCDGSALRRAAEQAQPIPAPE